MSTHGWRMVSVSVARRLDAVVKSFVAPASGLALTYGNLLPSPGNPGEGLGVRGSGERRGPHPASRSSATLSHFAGEGRQAGRAKRAESFAAPASGLALTYGRGRRSAFTLTEILVAIAIMLMITAAAIPVINSALTGRRAREATRALSVALDVARAKARELGRPVGVMLERTPGNPHYCQTISFCEAPEVYAGDSVISTLEAFVPNVTLPSQANNRPYGVNLVRPSSSTDSGWDVTLSTGSPPTPKYSLIREGDILWMQATGLSYRLEFGIDPTTGVTPFDDTGTLDTVEGWYIGRMLDVNPVQDNVYVVDEATDGNGTSGSPSPDCWFMNSDQAAKPELTQNGGVYEWRDASGESGKAVRAWTARSAPTPPGYQYAYDPGYDSTAMPGNEFRTPTYTPSPYRVYRQPVKSAIPAVQLPEAMVIDLMSSGITELPGVGEIPLTSDTRQDHDTFYPLRTADDTIGGAAAATNDGVKFPNASPNAYYGATETQPLIIMFAPDGSIEQIYHWGLDGAVKQLGESHSGVLYLLVAAREEMPLFSSLSSADWPTTVPRDAWRNTENLWLTVNTSSGNIHIQPVAPVVGDFDPKTSTTYPTTGSTPRTIERLYAGLWQSRAFCRDTNDRGGAK